MRARRLADLRVDKTLARAIRQRRGPAKYDAQGASVRDKVTRLLAAQAPPPVKLLLLCFGDWEFKRGSEHGLQLTEARDCELAVRALADEPQRFGIVLGNRIERGARGRIAEIIGHNILPDGVVVLVVEGGEEFVVRELVRVNGDRRTRNLEPVSGVVEVGEAAARCLAKDSRRLPSSPASLLRRSRSTPAMTHAAAA